MRKRKTNLYNRLWYVKKNRRKTYIYIFPLIILTVLILLFLYVENIMKPGFLEFSDYMVRRIINNSVAKAVNDNFPEEINYEEIVKINKDEFEKINSIRVDVGKLNRIFSKVTLSIQEELDTLELKKLGYPLEYLQAIQFFLQEGLG